VNLDHDWDRLLTVKRIWVTPAVLLAMVGCTSSPSVNASTIPSHSSPTKHASQLVDPGPTTTRPNTPSQSSLYPAVAGKVLIYLRPASVHAVADGHSFVVELVVVNGLGRPFIVPDVCNGWLEAGLASATITFGETSLDVGCAGQTVPVGATRLQRTISTSYEGCSQNPDGPFTANSPACLPHGTDPIPPLPAGNYRLQLYTTNIPHAVIANAVTVTLTKP
jgi:hypothetical protein